MPHGEAAHTLEVAGHPVVRFQQFPEAIAFGGEFFRWEVATATAGAILCINPLMSPNVAESKQHTRDLLSTWQQQGAASAEHPLLETNGVDHLWRCATAGKRGGKKAGSLRDFLQAFIGQMQAPDLPRPCCPTFSAPPVRPPGAAKRSGVAVRDRFRVATHARIWAAVPAFHWSAP